MKTLLANIFKQFKNIEVDETNIIPFPQPEDDHDPNGPACSMAA